MISRPTTKKQKFQLLWRQAVTSETWRDNILALAHSGRRVIAADSSHGIEATDVPEGRENIPQAELRKIAALIETLKKRY